MEKIWYSGVNNFQRHRLQGTEYTCELQDVELMGTDNIREILCAHVADRGTNRLEMLYSGGVDSEFCLKILHQAGYDITAITARLYLRNYLVNTHDLYYADNFCKQLGIAHKHVDIHVDKFLENGDHLAYMIPYNVTLINVAIQFRLLEQCTGFPIVGGDWPWLQTHEQPYRFSPFKYDFLASDLFMRDRGISGISNMLSSSLDSCIQFVKAHRELAARTDLGNLSNDKIGWLRIGPFKQQLFEKLAVDVKPDRIKSYGLDILHLVPEFYNYNQIQQQINDSIKPVSNRIVWQSKLAAAAGISAGENNSFI